jgi:hypothetical protein
VVFAREPQNTTRQPISRRLPIRAQVEATTREGYESIIRIQPMLGDLAVSRIDAVDYDGHDSVLDWDSRRCTLARAGSTNSVTLLDWEGRAGDDLNRYHQTRHNIHMTAAGRT